MTQQQNRGRVDAQSYPENQKKSWVNEYYNAAKSGFFRIWNNRFLWFWGFFLPVGMGASFNYNFSPEEKRFAGSESVDFAEVIDQITSFVHENLTWFIVGFALFVILGIVLWILSAIARLGVTKAIGQMQNPSASLTYDFKEIWNQGKSGFGKIMLIDFIIGLVLTLIGAILSLPIIILSLKGQFSSLIFVIILAFIIYVPLTILGYFLKTSGVVIYSLTEMEPKRSVEIAYGYVSKNIKEVFKLILTLLVMGILRGVAVLAAIFVVFIVGAILAFFFFVVFGFQAIAESSLVLLAVIAVFVLLLVLVAALALVKAVFSVWVWDVWVWWTKKNGALHVSLEKEDAVEVKTRVEQEVSPTVE